MEQPKLLLGRMKVIFILICFFAALYMTTTQIIRYLENDDSSSIRYKQFNQTPLDKYPTFSVCFKGPEIYWPRAMNIFEKFGISAKQYDRIIKGGTGIRYKNEHDIRLYRKETLEMRNVSNIAFEEHWHLKLTDFVVQAKFLSQNSEFSISSENFNAHDMEDEKVFYVGYQTSDTICFTRKSNDEPGAIRLKDVLTFKRLFLEEPWFDDTELRIFLHLPNQLLRSFSVPIYRARFKHVQHWNKRVELHVSQVTVLRRRINANDPCNDMILNDDRKMIEETVLKLGCVPIYWAKLVRNDIWYGNKTCNTSAKLKEASHYVETYKNILESYDPPCTSLSALALPFRQILPAGSNTEIQLEYATRSYQEIRNQEDFGFESFWSSVGGFIGIFMGYSLLQIPDLLKLLPAFIQKIKMVFLKRGEPEHQAN